MGAFVVKGGAFVYGSDPYIDALYPAQAIEGHHVKRAAVLETMQRLVIDKAIYAPIWQLAFINGVGPRVAELDFGRIPGLLTPCLMKTSRSKAT